MFSVSHFAEVFDSLRTLRCSDSFANHRFISDLRVIRKTALVQRDCPANLPFLLKFGKNVLPLP